MSEQKPLGLSYSDAGVDIDRGNELVRRIVPMAARTRREGVVEGLGGFGALFELPLHRYRNPVLVSGTDGVGTKLKLAIEHGHHATAGIDLVAMCANDLVVQGAEPLFFLDYYATGRLDLEVAAAVVDGIARGCELAGMALIGGETAEMPGMYQAGDYDLAGFCVGVVEKDAIVDGRGVQPGDVILALASSGPHSNGYSLIRKVLELSGADPALPLEDRPLLEHLMAPTRIYVRALLGLLAEAEVGAMAHITGGGLPENLPRVLPPGTRAVIEAGSWRQPAVFGWLQSEGEIDAAEMYRTFNCGVGMAVVLPEAEEQRALRALEAAGERAWRMGSIEAGEPGPAQVLIQ